MCTSIPESYRKSSRDTEVTIMCDDISCIVKGDNNSLHHAKIHVFVIMTIQVTVITIYNTYINDDGNM